MTAELGVDIAWARPTVAQIQATGAKWVARYFSTDSSKNLTPSEVHAYSAAGLGTVVVWETTTGRATQGYAAGVSDARAAESQRQTDGLPSNMPIYFAVDEDTSWSSVAQYFAGAASVVGRALTGVYGGFTVIEGAHTAGYTYLWQTVAWSGGRWSSHASIRQTGAIVLGGNADIDYAETADFGEYPRPITPTPTPPEDVVTPQDKQDIIDGVAAKLESGSTGGQFDRDRMAGATVYWLRRALDPSIPLPTGKDLPSVVGEVAALRATLAAERAAAAAQIATLEKAVAALTPAPVKTK
ncbi:glycoside hydrolase domain-containing protein [Streptacidiphilus carbonis]|uniref:glycoside hydrolase domain-containing protein n=1 Tax=Streptacidiphilus carbonis TaxID=105422 RepID=UPI000694C949|nr:glycoside hydrolase domain-containing protein [Streptacidiphilus carbonis]